MKKTFRVVVVDEVDAVRTLLQTALIGAGFRTESVADAAAALIICRNRTVDLVITDLLASGNERVETITTLRKEFPNMPIIVISDASVRVLEDALLLGASAALPKPLDVRELLITVRRLLSPPDK